MDPRSALRLLLGKRDSSARADPDPTVLSWLTSHVQEAARAAQALQIMRGGVKRSVADALDPAIHGDVETVCEIANIALQALLTNKDLKFASEVAQIMVAKEELFPHYISQFYALALSAEHLMLDGAIELAISAYSGAVLTLCREGNAALRIPNSALSAFAILWQRLGRALASTGLLESASLCAGVSAKLFRHIGRIDGEIRSELDAVSSLAQVGATSKVVDSALALLAKIRDERARQPDQRETLADSEVECLMRIGDLLYQMSTERPRLIELEMRLERKDGERADADVFDALRLPISIPDQDEQVTLTVEEVARFLDTVGSRNSKRSDDKLQADDDDSSPSGVVFITTVSLSDKDSYIHHAQIIGVAWYSAYREASDLAVKLGIRDRWLNAHMQLFERAIKFSRPALILYLYRVFLERSKRYGFGEPGPEYLATLLPSITEALSDSGRRVTDYSLGSPELDRALHVGMTWLTNGIWPKGVSAWWSLSIGEVLEAQGQYDESVRAYQMTYDTAMARLASATDQSYRNQLRSALVGSLYRSARADIKQHRRTGESSYLWRAVSKIDAYRSGVLERDLKVPEYGFIGLKKVAPENSVCAIYALLQKTDLNEGFWFLAFIDVHRQEIFFSNVRPFEAIFEPFKAAESAFNAARRALEGEIISGAAAARDTGHDVELAAALEALADVLLPRPAVEVIEQRGFRNLLFMPESYLFDVPFAALRVQGCSGRIYTFELNAQVLGTRISVVPNCSMIDPRQGRWKFDFLGGYPTYGRCCCRYQSRMEEGTCPLFGVLPRVDRFLARINAIGAVAKEPNRFVRGGTVADFLRIVRSCEVGLFFGHGEIIEGRGSVLVADDGLVGDLEVKQNVGVEVQPVCSLVLLCACSGINSQATLGITRRELAGVHVALVRRGARFVVGSVAPLFPIAALHLLESIVDGVESGLEMDDTLKLTYQNFVTDVALRSPVFWGHIVGFGDGRFAIDKEAN
jgi:hypothetical protein